MRATHAKQAAAAAPFARAGMRHLACVKVGREWLVLDGEGLGALPRLECANDPRGTGLTATCTVSAAGVMMARRGVPALDLTRPLRDQITSELTWEYGARYWAIHG